MNRGIEVSPMSAANTKPAVGELVSRRAPRAMEMNAPAR
jgi:hypothetical protein